MLRSKILLFFVLLSFQIGFGQSFTYSGPTTATILFGNTSATANYTFTYSGLNGLLYPSIGIGADGTTLLAPRYCTTDSFLPTNYTITFSGPGTHTVNFKLTKIVDNGTPCGARVLIQEYSFNVEVRFQISVENNFGGGSINANGNTTSPARISSSVGSVSIGAIEQNYDGYYRVWNTSETNKSKWTSISDYNGTSDFSSSSSTSYSIQSNDLNTRVVAGLRKRCSLTFQNSNGSMYVAGGTYSSSATVGVVEQNSITAYGNTYVVNGIEYRFTNWTKEGSAYGQTITPDAHGTYTANYDNGRPVYVDFYFGTVLNAPIKVMWTDNPNTAVTFYNIYRREKINGVFTDPVQIGTVNRGVGYYNDADYTLAYAKNGIWLEYSVEAYYSTVGSYSDHGWLIAYGNVGASMQNNDLAITKTESEVPVEFAISNYPNPFNPTTTINYQLPKAGKVTIKVYDVLGKEVATLVNEQKSAGYYKVDFDASKLTSGVYIAAIQASNFNKSIKLLLTK